MLPILWFGIIWLATYRLVAFVLPLLPIDLRQTSQVVGLPLFVDFDITRYIAEQYIYLLLPPLIASLLMPKWAPIPAAVIREGAAPGEKYLDVALSILVPLSVFLILMQVPGSIDLSHSDFFHVGEQAVPASLLVAGRVPWRDFVFVHGLLQDGIVGALGMWVWGKTLWASQAGKTLWVLPFISAALALFYQRVFRHHLAMLGIAIILLIAPPPFLPVFPLRFGLVPLCLCALLWYLEKPRWPQAVVLSAFCVAQLFLTPEFVFFALAFGAVTFVADLQAKERFERTLRFGGLSFALIAAVFIGLAVVGALIPFLRFAISTASGHKFTGGGPQNVLNPVSFALLYLTIGICVGFAVAKVRTKEKFTPEELTLGALFLFLVLYFQKFACRADNPHLNMVWGAAVPLFIYVCSRVVRYIDTLRPVLQRIPVRDPIALFLFVAIAISTRHRIANVWSSANVLRRITVVLQKEERYPQLGAVVFDANLRERISTLSKFFEHDKSAVFDFTGQPLLFHFLLERPVATRFPYVSLAINPSLQNTVIKELETAKPEWVVFDSTSSPLAHWDDVSNFVRHYKVSAYLLSHYSPVEWVKDDLILRRGRPNSGAAAKLYEDTQVCDWGYVLSYWSHPAERYSSERTSSVLVPANIQGSPVTLELSFRTVGNGTVELRVPGLRTPIARFQTKKADWVTYQVPVGSCPLWYTRPSELQLKSDHPVELVRADWVRGS